MTTAARLPLSLHPRSQLLLCTDWLRCGLCSQTARGSRADGLQLAPQLFSIAADCLAAELSLCWGRTAEAGVLGGRLQSTLALPQRAHQRFTGHTKALHRTLGRQNTALRMHAGTSFVASCVCYGYNNENISRI